MQPTVEEQGIWHGTPSQWLNFRTYLLAAIATIAILVALVATRNAMAGQPGDAQNWVSVAFVVAILLPLFFIVRAYLVVRTTGYQVTTQRVLFSRGIFSKQTDNLELYRVDDTQLLQPFLLRLVSLGNIHLITSDRTNPEMVLRAVPNSVWLRDQLRQNVELCRDRKRTRVIDFIDEN